MILGLKRYGQTGASSYGLIDNLSLTLNGNQLKAVNDAVTTSAYNNGFEFKAVSYTHLTAERQSIFMLGRTWERHNSFFC